MKNFNVFLLLILAISIASNNAIAADNVEEVMRQTCDSSIATCLNIGLAVIVYYLNKVLFYEIFQIPVLVIWLILASIFFTFYLRFCNFTLFGHSFKVVAGKYDNNHAEGEVSHFQALAAAVSGTVGLGNVSGTAIAITAGGPGAVIWMVVGGVFGMAAKFAEVTLGMKYRKIDETGKISGGAFHYINAGLSDLNMPKLGKFLAAMFAIFCFGGCIGAGNSFQSNQTVVMILDTFNIGDGYSWLVSLILTTAVAIVLIGGMKRLASVAEAIVPIMTFTYLGGAFVVLVTHYDSLISTLSLMFHQAFTLEAAGGGMVGALIAGMKRGTMAHEAGLGSAPIAHAAAKTDEPVREGCVALLEPFIVTTLICFMTGIAMVVTGAYQAGGEGIIIASKAFSSVASWFPTVLSFALVLFAYSTIITWSYYGERSWGYLFGSKNVVIFQIAFCLATFIGGIASFDLINKLSELLMLCMSVPNIIGLLILAKVVKKDMIDYKRRLDAKEF